MFIRFTQKDGTVVVLNTDHVVSIQTPPPLAGIQGGQTQIRIHCLEGRVFTLDAKEVSAEEIMKHLDPKGIKDVGQDQSSPIG